MIFFLLYSFLIPTSQSLNSFFYSFISLPSQFFIELTVIFWGCYGPLCSLDLGLWWRAFTYETYWMVGCFLHIGIGHLFRTQLALTDHLVPCSLKTFIALFALSESYQEICLRLFILVARVGALAVFLGFLWPCLADLCEFLWCFFILIRYSFASNLIVLVFFVIVFPHADFLERSLFSWHVGYLLLVVLNIGLVNGSSWWRFCGKFSFVRFK